MTRSAGASVSGAWETAGTVVTSPRGGTRQKPHCLEGNWWPSRYSPLPAIRWKPSARSRNALIEASWIGALLATSLCLGLAWSFSVPFNGGPDETAHLDVAQFIYRHGRLPLFDPTELWVYRTLAGAVESYATYPPLAYLPTAALLPLFDGTFWAGRAVSLGSYVGTVLASYAIARRLLQDRGAAANAAAFVAFLPQATFTAAYFNSDAVGLFLQSMVFFSLLRMWERPTPRAAALVGLIAAALLLTKYPYYPAVVVALSAGLIICRRGSKPWACTAGLMLGCTALCGWWFVRNWLLYGQAIPVHAIEVAKASAGGNTLFVAAQHGVNLLTLSFATDFWEATLQSFVGNFGFQTIFLEPSHYAACSAVAALGAGGLLAAMYRARHSQQWRAPALIGGATTFVTILGAMAISTFGEYSPQGRYLFPGLIPIAIALTIGLRNLGSRPVPGQALGWAAAGALAVLNLHSLTARAVPAYYGPSSQHIVLQIDNPRGDQLDGKTTTTLSGWSVVEAASNWEPLSPRSVSNYRRPVDRIDIYLDGPPGKGAPLGKAYYGARRSDVSALYGGARSLEQVGYELETTSIQRGRHTLYVCAYSDTALPRYCRDRLIVVL